MKLEQAKEELNKLLKPPVNILFKFFQKIIIIFFVQIEGEDHLKKKQLTELAILKGTYRDPNTFSKNFNQIQMGAPFILTPDLLTSPIQTHSTLTAIPQTSLMQNDQSNFLQIFTPFQTIDQMGGLLTNEPHLFEYPTQTGKKCFCFIRMLDFLFI